MNTLALPPSHYAVRATAFVLVERAAGAWVPVDHIARDMAAPFDRVLDACMELTQHNQVQHGRNAQGRHFVGVRCEGQPIPPEPASTPCHINTTTSP